MAFTHTMIAIIAFAQSLMTVPDQVVLESPSTSETTLNVKVWAPRQKTRWTLVDGVIKGEASTPEYQASRKDHKGLEPRLAIPTTPQDFYAEFDVRFTGGTFAKLAPFIEFGHHKARFSFGKDEVSLNADSGKAKLASTTKAQYQDGHWYHIIAEQKGEEAVMQIDGVPVYGSHPSLKEPTEKGAAGLGFCGSNGGTVEIRGLKIWSVKADCLPTWSDLKAKIGKGG